MKIIRKLRKKSHSLKLMTKHVYQNITSKEPLQFDDSRNIHISLTSYGNKLKRVFITIEAIVNQSTAYSSLTLWLSKQDITEQQLPLSLKRLQARGLRICFVEDNIKSYKKLYYNYLENKNNEQALLVTADDDVIYSHDWLKQLVDKSQQSKGVICHRGHRITLDKDYVVRPYKNWGEKRTDITDEVLLMPTGVSGALYPIASLKGLDEQYDAFIANAPHADDLWFKCLTLKNGYGSFLAFEQGTDYPSILELNTKRRGLALINVHQGGNDKQMKNVVQYFNIDFKAYLNS